VERHLGAPLHSYDGAGGGQILGNWGQAERKRQCGIIVEAINHPTLHHTSIIHAYEVFEHLHMLWKGICVHPYTVIPVEGGGQILENWGQVKLKRHCFDFVEAVNHPTLYHTSIIHVYEVFEHLHMLWNGICVQPYTVMMVQGGGKFWKIGVWWS
jgi:hypothetical protein